ncbi:MAG: transcription-repair coupling factor [Deferrisomatales bacterium]|nr:transcription-repair coupling factor [Deferrisomatales bacterium]
MTSSSSDRTFGRFEHLLEALRADRRVRAQGLRGSSRAFLLARLLRVLGQPVLVLTPTLTEARRFADELRFFLGTDGEERSPADPPVVVYPGWDAAPFEGIAPIPEVSSRRISALYRASQPDPFALVAPVSAVLQRAVPPGVIDGAGVRLRAGDELDREAFLRRLVEAGYHSVGQVEERGEVSLRGGIVDVFAPHYPNPLRIELFGDQVESLRAFDPETQRSTRRLEEAVVLPAREAVADPAALERASVRLRARCRELGLSRARTAEALEGLRSGGASPLRDVLYPYFSGGAVPVWAHLPAGSLAVFDEAAAVEERAGEVFEEIRLSHARALEREQAVPDVGEVYLSPEEWGAFGQGAGRLDLEELETEGGSTHTIAFSTQSNQDLTLALRQNRGSDRLLTPLVEEIARSRERGQSLWLAARSSGAVQRLRDLLGSYGVRLGEVEPFPEEPPRDGKLHVAVGKLARGFRFPAKGIAVVTETEILGEKVRRSAPVQRRGFRSTLADLQPADAIVHEDFGVGLYRGLVRLEVAGEEGDYLHLEYADGDRLYLPVTRIGLVRKYSGPGEGLPRLDKLGGKAWEKARRKAREGIEKMALELLELYARRQLATRPPYPPADVSYRELEATFPYEETPDQLSAIEDVLRDLDGPHPMDRLICGDVGYGKTEVAIRATFRAVTGGRQVAVLVPTTVLAAQHFQSFRKRFEGYPLNVEMLSRFVSPAEQKNILARIARGGVDVVVGTHRLLQRDLTFKNLGLVVVDEEHRFGVSHKERLKRLRARVDVLTLSATPIPRTLNMGLSGVRDLSVIETPPADRLAVRTTLARFDDDVIREALQRELHRGGQIYFVHNRVQSIEAMAAHVSRLVPGARVAIGHGQMRERDLEQVMERFVAGELDVLVCTAIIESGLDIARANTIVINRADLFGLADLYQLRGRVGRANLRAYAVLLVPEEAELTGDARKRLQALQEFTELGAGFKIATHDLEIRGAGELLGKAQSGQMAAIGFDLYAELLEEAVQRLRGEPVERPPEPEIRLRVPAHFPLDYVEDPRQRLVLYERLTRVGAVAEVDELRYELIDRYGPVPLPVENLLEVMKIRRLLLDLRATGLDYTGRDLVVSFGEEPRVDPARVLALVRGEPGRCRVTPDNRILWGGGALESSQVLAAARELLNRLG